MPIGSKYQSKTKDVMADFNKNVVLEPIKQAIGKKAVPWKTRSNIKGDFSY